MAIDEQLEVRLGFRAGPDGVVPLHLCWRWTVVVGHAGQSQPLREDSLGLGWRKSQTRYPASTVQTTREVA